jgi:hypothetical protein
VNQGDVIRADRREDEYSERGPMIEREFMRGVIGHHSRHGHSETLAPFPGVRIRVRVT